MDTDINKLQVCLERPYQCKVYGWFTITIHIFYNDEFIGELVGGSREFASQLEGLLNGAYSMGCSDQFIRDTVLMTK